MQCHFSRSFASPIQWVFFCQVLVLLRLYRNHSGSRCHRIDFAYINNWAMSWKTQFGRPTSKMPFNCVFSFHQSEKLFFANGYIISDINTDAIKITISISAFVAHFPALSSNRSQFDELRYHLFFFVFSFFFVCKFVFLRIDILLNWAL